MISKTREGAKVPSREAVFLQFDPHTVDPTGVMGVKPIGGPNVDALINGVNYPNIQNAIDELAATTQLPINAIYTSAENTAPRGIQQSERLTFSGQVTGAPGATAVVYVYGVPVVCDVGDNADAVCNKVLAEFTQMKNSNIAFSTVERQEGTVTPILNVKFIDNCAHVNLGDFVSQGITVQREVLSPGQAGYGTWTALGQEEKFGVTMYYFKRIA